MGTEEFWVPAVIAAVGTAGEYVNQQQANKRQDAAEAQAIMDQQAIQGKATAAAGKTIQQIQQSNPNDIAAKSTGEYVSTLRKNAAASAQPGTTSSLAPVAGGSSRYKSDVASSATSGQQFGSNIADIMGNVDAAVRQRQNEGLAMQDLGTKLNTFGAESYTKNFVDQLRAQMAGQQNPWVSLGAGMLKSGASAYAMGAGGGKVPKVPGVLSSTQYQLPVPGMNA